MMSPKVADVLTGIGGALLLLFIFGVLFPLYFKATTPPGHCTPTYSNVMTETGEERLYDGCY